MTAHEVHAPSSSGLQPALGAPISMRGMRLRPSVAFRPSMTSGGQGRPGQQLQNLAKCGRGSSPNASVVQRMEWFTRRIMAQFPVQECSATVPMHRQRWPSKAQKCRSIRGKSPVSRSGMDPPSWNSSAGGCLKTGTSLPTASTSTNAPAHLLSGSSFPARRAGTRPSAMHRAAAEPTMAERTSHLQVRRASLWRAARLYLAAVPAPSESCITAHGAISWA
mmetsp:Transcript_116805/g.342019  ORF Transcript_116805/g.342019 Transcript_116805/m.342019 type:complete len:221 (+) Transcript_116805:675-1337(+)